MSASKQGMAWERPRRGMSARNMPTCTDVKLEEPAAGMVWEGPRVSFQDPGPGSHGTPPHPRKIFNNVAQLRRGVRVSQRVLTIKSGMIFILRGVDFNFLETTATP